MLKGRTDFGIELTKESIPVLCASLKVISRKESIGGKGEADVSRLGDVVVDDGPGKKSRLVARVACRNGTLWSSRSMSVCSG